MREGIDNLTPGQLNLLRYIVGYFEHQGFAPALSEMRDALGFSSKSRVHEQLVRLEAAGVIRRLRGRERAIDVLSRPSLPRTADGAPLFFVPLKKPVHHEVGNA